MFAFDKVTAYLMVVCLASLLAAVLLWQRHRTQRTIAVWLAASVLGVLLGSIGSYAAVRLAGYELIRFPRPSPCDVPVGAGQPGMGGSQDCDCKEGAPVPPGSPPMAEPQTTGAPK